MATSPTDTQKFRPYFTTAELAELIRCVKASSTNQSLLAYLEAFALKIDRGLLQSQLTVQPSMEQRLGMVPSSTSILAPTPIELYQQWKTDPTKLIPSQLAIVHTYRWENGFMTDEESARFEQSMLDGGSTI